MIPKRDCIYIKFYWVLQYQFYWQLSIIQVQNASINWIIMYFWSYFMGYESYHFNCLIDVMIVYLR